MGNLFFDEPKLPRRPAIAGTVVVGSHVRVVSRNPTLNGFFNLEGVVLKIEANSIERWPINVRFDPGRFDAPENYPFVPEELELIAPPQENTHGQQARPEPGFPSSIPF